MTDKKILIARITVLLFSALIFYGCAGTTNEEVDGLFVYWDSDRTPGAAVAVVKDGSIIYKKGYGRANLEYAIPINPSTVFHIASVSKQFTVFSILLLEKEGKLSLDDDIRKYIEEVPNFGKTITLRHLASHTSGLRDQWDLLAMAGWRLDDVITKEHVLKVVSRQKELNFEPGEEFLYSNTGFTLLAEVVSRVSGQTFADFAEKNIFDPLKMNHTLFYDDHEKIVENRAYSYYPDSTGYKKSILSYANVGATSLFSTVEDLSIWAMNFSSPKVGDLDIISKMNTLAVLNDGKTFGGALGQFVGKYKGLNQIQHSGADAGYRSYLTRFPDEDFSVIVLSNDASFNAASTANKMVDIYLKDKIIEGPKDDAKFVDRRKKLISVDQKTLKSYIGEFELQPGFFLTITEDNGQLFSQPTGQTKLPLEPLSTTEFAVKGIEAKITFSSNGNEQTNNLQIHQGGQIINAQRVRSLELSTLGLSEYIGHFYSEELSTSYHFKVLGDKLIAQHSRLSDIELKPKKEDLFYGNKWFFGQTQFIRDTNNVVIGCKVSSGRVRNLWFQKVD